MKWNSDQMYKVIRPKGVKYTTVYLVHIRTCREQISHSATPVALPVAHADGVVV